MKQLITLVLTLFTVQIFGQDTAQIEQNVQKSVLEWADQTFKSYDNPRFENLSVFYSDAYQMWQMRPAMLRRRMKRLNKLYKRGKTDLTEDEYKEEKSKLNKQIKDAQKRLENIDNFADRITISFWANIQTNDGITVQYEHIVSLDSDYNVTDAKVNSSIGKKSENTKIVYK